jgi:hypothetical protein
VIGILECWNNVSNIKKLIRYILYSINYPSFHNHGDTYEETEKNESLEGSLEKEKY